MSSAQLISINDFFTNEELLIILETARLAMADEEIFDHIADEMDISDFEMIKTRERLLKFMEEE